VVWSILRPVANTTAGSRESGRRWVVFYFGTPPPVGHFFFFLCPATIFIGSHRRFWCRRCVELWLLTRGNAVHDARK